MTFRNPILVLLLKQNKITHLPYFLMLLVSSFSILGSLVVIFLPESMPPEAMKRDPIPSQHIGDESHEERSVDNKVSV